MPAFRPHRVWLGACYGVASLLPWVGLSLQESSRYTPNEHLVWPWGAVAAGAQAAALIAILILRQMRQRIEDSPTVEKSPHKSLSFILRAAIVMAATAVVIGVLLAKVWHFLRQFWLDPINPTQGDMLPLIQQALRSFFLDHHSPYGPHVIAHWELPLTFWPGLWLPFALPWQSDCDIRLWTLAALALTGLMLMAAGADAALRVRVRNWAGALALLALAALGPLLLPGFREFVPQLHVAGFWLVLGAWGLAVLYRFPVAAGALFGLAVLGRPFAIVLIPLYGIYLLRLWGEDRPRAVKQAASAAAVLAVFGLPFFLWSPGDFLSGVLGGYEKALNVHIIQNPLAAHGFGLSGLMQELGLTAWKMRVAGVVQVALLVWAWRRLRREDDLLIFSAVALFFFLYFSFIPWFYTFVGPLILLAVAHLADGAPPERFVIRSREWRQLAMLGAVMAVIGAAGALLSIWTIHEPPDHPYKVNGVTEELINTKYPLFAFEYYGWVDNLGYNYWAILDGNAYAGVPVRMPQKFSHVAVTIRARRAPPDGLTCRVFVNGEYSGEGLLGAEGLNTIHAALPRRSLFAGTNAVRLEFQSGGRTLEAEEIRAMDLDLGQIRFITPDEWRQMGQTLSNQDCRQFQKLLT